MTRKHALVFGIALIAATGYVIAQPGGHGGHGGPGMPPGGEDMQPPEPPPIIAALDVDDDHILSAEEIANSPTNLLTLDADSDGQLTLAEMLPAPPEDAEEPEGDEEADAPRPRGPVYHLVIALDTDADQILSAEEIANAPASLLTLDTNEDGQLSFEDRPEPGEGGPGGGHGGPGCHRGHGGPGGQGGPGMGHGMGPGMGGPRVPALLILLDTDQDGELSAEELAAAATVLGALDADGDGIVTAEELRPPRPEGAPEDGTNPMAERLMALDTDGDGYVSFAEFAAKLQPIFDRLDSDDDGQISQAEAEAGPGQPSGDDIEEDAVETETEADTESDTGSAAADVASDQTESQTVETATSTTTTMSRARKTK